MVRAFPMAAEARVAGLGFVFVVGGMAGRAGLVFALEVEPGQLGELVATRAGRWLRGPVRAVRSMTGEAAGADLLAVRAGGLPRVAVAAGLARGGAGVGLVAARAGLVPARRRLAFLRVAAAAGRCLRARMGFVALVAAGVARVHLLVLLAVARLAAHLQLRRLVWQALVAAGARGMPDVDGDLLHARGVAGRAGGHVRRLEREVVRLVAPGTRHLCMLAMFGADAPVA